MSNKTSFGGWLKQRRSELGVTQEELSNQLVFSSALLRKLESSERRPSGQVAALLAEYFHIPVDEQEAFITFARTGGMVSSTSYTATPGNATSLSPWRRLYRHQTNLPATLTPILGRQREKETAMGHLLNSKTRLLTLTGMLGIGKTRLGSSF
jgi:transcriptional regulator with XRE-family HTH domain